ncbi:PH, RCC1 and FYVE domains-containing protein 1 [Argentina anserina]|uniref:PH, RCC1 and FYVE domains-containing protein 1 n=1 Tax=Argentina anserina TaxID=57926 RepID=UPI0021766ADB|nr:PH, RCC1 and FYVE domains-containing protein 1 [Potentilla anserina]XP_050375189.1 PH, RCC1 and FYVE domains-containing protein 1 [Potentilla anserina]
MASPQSIGPANKDIDQAIAALKKGATLLKYGRRGKPKFCPFRLSNDEALLIWYSGKDEKHIRLSHVSTIIPGQRTAIFQRYPRPEKEYQSFSLLYNDRSLDLICKDKDEAEVWFVGLKALINQGSYRNFRSESRSDNSKSTNTPLAHTRRSSPSIAPFICDAAGDAEAVSLETARSNRLGRAFADIISYTDATKTHADSASVSSLSPASVDNSNGRSSTSEAFRISLSSAVSSSSQGSYPDDFDALGDVFIWGEGINGGTLGGNADRTGSSVAYRMDALLPKALESTMVIDAQGIACGSRHIVLVTRQGETFSWGEESGGRLGHGVEADVSHPKLIGNLSGRNVELVACGEYHTCAVTFSGELYTWGDGTNNFGLLGHGSEVSHWMPKKVSGHMEGIHVSYISCGLWHTATVSSDGRLFTFGDGSFGALGHGDHSSTSTPREVETLRGMRTARVACGAWHTAAVVDILNDSSRPEDSGNSTSGKLYTWGDGDKGLLGHGDETSRLAPECVATLIDKNFCQVACGHSLTVSLTTSGQVYTMGSTAYGQLGSPSANGKVPTLVEGKIADRLVEEIACGSCHVAVLTSKAEVYTWGRGSNGQLGHGDSDNRRTPTLVEYIKDKQVKSVVCGSNITAVICLHKWASGADHSVCSSCHNPFGFRRKRHNCYNCGLVFCKACSSKKILKAALAPNTNKPYRVCDDCYTKIKKVAEASSGGQNPKTRSGQLQHKSGEMTDKETLIPKLRATLSRISSFGSGASQTESKIPKPERRPEARDSRVFPMLNGNVQLGSFTLSKTSLDGHPGKFMSASMPTSRRSSLFASPVSVKLNSDQSSEDVLEDPKLVNASLNQEIINLKSQVEDLTSKSQRLEAELQKTLKKLNEVSAVATDEAEKSKSSKAVIKSLTAQVKQLKEMAERMPEGHAASCISGSSACAITGSSLTNITSPQMESSGNSMDRLLANGTKSQSGKSERVIQDEPGVYITLCSLPGGGNELRRVRFSRRHFTEETAERWWADNGAKLCEVHNIQGAE